MEIDAQALTSCGVADDGCAVSLGFVDAAGNPATIRLSLKQVGALVMTLPALLQKALQTRYGDQSLRYAYPLASWTVTIDRPDPAHGHATDGGRLQCLFRSPPRTAERARRGLDGPIGIESNLADELERFRAKWTPVRVKKTRQNKNLGLWF
jgi:hypothetical protein